MSKLAISILFIILNINFAFAKSEKITIGNFRYYNISAKVAKKLRWDIREYIYSLPHFDFRSSELYTSNISIDKSLSREQIINIAKRTKVDVVIVGSINKSGNYKIILKFLDGQTGKPRYISKQYVDTPDEISEVSIKIVHNYAIDYVYPNKTGFLLRGVVPGWSQHYTDQHFKSGIFAGAFVGVSIYSLYWLVQWKSQYREYKNFHTSDPDTHLESERKYQSALSSKRKWKESFYYILALYVLNFADMGIFTPNFQDNFNIEKGISLYKNSKINIYANIKIDNSINNKNMYNMYGELSLTYHF